MAAVVTRQQVIDTLSQSASQLPEAFAFGESLAQEIDRIYFVAHGSGNRAMLGISYWVEHYSPSIEVRRYFPSEFMAINPPRLDERTEASDARGLELAREYYQDDKIYHVAAGPGFMSAYNFGVCILMEMLWLHSYPIEAAEFFHGPFEILDEDTPFILIVGEDPSRPLMERVMRFCEKHGRRIMIFDSKDFSMPGIAPSIRPIVAPHVVQTALKRFSEHLSDLRGQPLSTRRYMWKSEY